MTEYVLCFFFSRDTQPPGGGAFSPCGRILLLADATRAHTRSLKRTRPQPPCTQLQPPRAHTTSPFPGASLGTMSGQGDPCAATLSSVLMPPIPSRSRTTVTTVAKVCFLLPQRQVRCARQLGLRHTSLGSLFCTHQCVGPSTLPYRLLAPRLLFLDTSLNTTVRAMFEPTRSRHNKKNIVIGFQ
jgi:hypothetical protein